MNTKFKITTAILSAGLLITPISSVVQNNNNIAKANYNNKLTIEGKKLNNKELQAKHKDDYVQARLLDTMPIMDGMAKLRQVYHRCMTIDLVGRVVTPMADMDEAVFKELNERELFNQFAETVWKNPLTEREQQYINSVWDRILKED